MKILDLLRKSALVLKIFSKKAAYKEAEIPFCRRKLSRFLRRMVVSLIWCCIYSDVVREKSFVISFDLWEIEEDKVHGIIKICGRYV
jgi:hypothetical protein